jgi:hypothetical protein
MKPITRESLRAYMSDALPDAELAAVERALRESADLRGLLRDVIEQEDRGEHSAGAVWRRERVSCPNRDQLGGFVLGAGDPDLFDYIRFHIEEIGCPYCRANVDDMREQGTGKGKPKGPAAKNKK